mmetsp:Transcript_6913/g.24418  ORF Transcript_6913/g.24418 Transcript_6913/m.24418 type:complete len:631 (-) Transcript_6913:1328-3220(-)
MERGRARPALRPAARVMHHSARVRACNTHARSQRLGDLEAEVRPLLRGGLRRLRRAHRRHPPRLPADSLQRLAERLEVLVGRGQDLLAALLPLLVRDLQHVAHERRVPLGIRQLVGVNVPDGAHHRLGHRLAVELELAQELRRAVVRVHRLEQVRVAVRHVREDAAVGVEVGEAAVRPPGDAHLVPQVRRAQELVGDVRAALQVVPGVLVEVRGLGHVVHLRRHREQLVAARQGRRPVLDRGAARRHGGEELVQRAARRVQALAVQREVDDGAVAGQQARPNLLEVRAHPVPVAVHPRGQVAEVREGAVPAHLLRRPPRDGALGPEAGCHHAVAGAHHAALHGAPRLQHELHELGLVVEARVKEDVAHEAEEVARAARHHLAPHLHVARQAHLAVLAHVRRERRDADAARGAADALVELDEVLLARAHGRQGVAEEGHQRQEPRGDAAHVEQRVSVQDVVGEEVVAEHSRALLLGHVARHGGRLLRDVAQGERGDALERLGVVGRLLRLLERGRRLDERLELRRGHLAALLVQPRLLRGLRLLAQGRVGRQLQGHLVRVLHQVLPEQRAEDVLASSDALLQLAQGRLVPQGLEGVHVVQPRGHGAEHQRQPSREAPSVVLAEGKLDGVHG